MSNGKLTRFRIFLWDQFILPIHNLRNIYQLQALLLALLIVNFFVWKSLLVLIISSGSLILIYIYQLIKYYKSGEFMYNYRKYKSAKGQYKDYSKAINDIKDPLKGFPEDDLKEAPARR